MVVEGYGLSEVDGTFEGGQLYEGLPTPNIQQKGKLEKEDS